MIVYTFTREWMKSTVHLSAAVQINTPDNSQNIPYHSSEESSARTSLSAPSPAARHSHTRIIHLNVHAQV